MGVSSREVDLVSWAHWIGVSSNVVKGVTAERFDCDEVEELPSHLPHQRRRQRSWAIQKLRHGVMTRRKSHEVSAIKDHKSHEEGDLLDLGNMVDEDSDPVGRTPVTTPSPESEAFFRARCASR